jgi:hypothetical protein
MMILLHRVIAEKYLPIVVSDKSQAAWSNSDFQDTNHPNHCKNTGVDEQTEQPKNNTT